MIGSKAMPRVAALVAALVVASGCAPADPVPDAPSEQVPSQSQPESPATDAGAPASDEIAWIGTELTDAVTGEPIRLRDYKGTPVLLHAFAVW